MKKKELSSMCIGLVVASTNLSWGLNAPLPDWLQRFHIGGSAATRFMMGEARAQLERNSGFMVYQAGLVFDVDVAPNLTFWYDTDVTREGVARSSTSGQQVYARVDNLLGREWLNVKIGRTFMPFGEEYLRWDAIDNPLGSYTTSLPWAQDEGVLLFGDLLPKGELSYATALQNGNAGFNFDDNPNKTFSARLSSQILPWLHVSGSYLNLGKQGSTTSKGTSEFWLSGFHIQPLGTTSAASGASPSNIVTAQGFEGDMVVSESSLGRIWANYGYLYISDGGGNQFNRTIRWYTGEIMGNLPKTSQKAYLIGRYSAIGTFDPTVGYRFAGTELASTNLSNNSSPYSALNYDQRDLFRWSVGGGYRFTENVLGKIEYTWEDTHLISSALDVPAEVAQLKEHNFFIAELAFKF
jgi:hypothetical protein